MNAEPMNATSGQTGKMRRLLNILAVIICAITGLLGAGGALIFVGALVPLFRNILGFPADLTGLYFLLLGAGFGFLGFLITSRALLHLRHPDAGTARDMIGTAIFLIVIMGVLPLGTGLYAPSSLLFAALIGLYVFHRYLVKKVTAQAFPPDVTPSQT
jgi:hypothetical protein